MEAFHRRLVAGVVVTATHASAILTVNRDKKHEISLAVSSKDRKYRADRMFDVRRIHGTMSTNNMDSRCQSINDENYFQIFGNKELFV